MVSKGWCRGGERFRRVAVVLAIGSAGSVGCSPDAPLELAGRPLPDCTTTTETYENFGAGFFQSYCLRCHSVALETDLQRFDAPQGIDFNTLQMAREFARRIRLRAGELGDMPPQILLGPRPGEAERLRLIDWIDCGMRSESEMGGG